MYNCIDKTYTRCGFSENIRERQSRSRRKLIDGKNPSTASGTLDMVRCDIGIDKRSPAPAGTFSMPRYKLNFDKSSPAPAGTLSKVWIYFGMSNAYFRHQAITFNV